MSLNVPDRKASLQKKAFIPKVASSLLGHLAASVSTLSVSVFRNHTKPGNWFPFGAHNRVFYRRLAWSGDILPVVSDVSGEANITLMPAAPVLDACKSLLGQEGLGESKQ